jgi:hypothetical protein
LNINDPKKWADVEGKKYIIRANTPAYRRLAFGDWTAFITSKEVCYDEFEIVIGLSSPGGYFYFNLPAEASPYVQLRVKRGDVTVINPHADR